jgi:hypothetical protein
VLRGSPKPSPGAELPGSKSAPRLTKGWQVNSLITSTAARRSTSWPAPNAAAQARIAIVWTWLGKVELLAFGR